MGELEDRFAAQIASEAEKRDEEPRRQADARATAAQLAESTIIDLPKIGVQDAEVSVSETVIAITRPTKWGLVIVCDGNDTFRAERFHQIVFVDQGLVHLQFPKTLRSRSAVFDEIASWARL